VHSKYKKKIKSKKNTKVTKCQNTKIQTQQNTKWPYLFECAEMQMQQNTKAPQYKCDKIQNDKKQMGQM